MWQFLYIALFALDNVLMLLVFQREALYFVQHYSIKA